jgi:hypothetical protein
MFPEPCLTRHHEPALGVVVGWRASGSQNFIPVSLARPNRPAYAPARPTGIQITCTAAEHVVVRCLHEFRDDASGTERPRAEIKCESSVDAESRLAQDSNSHMHSGKVIAGL